MTGRNRKHKTGGRRRVAAENSHPGLGASLRMGLGRLGPAQRLALVFAIYFAVRWFVLWGVEPVQFSDSASYVEQYRHGFGEGFFGRVRTWAYPLFIRLSDFDLRLVVGGQRLVAALAWFGLAVAAAGLFRSAAARRVAFWGTLVVSLGLVVMIWDAAILSESFSNSLFIGLTAALAWFLGARGAGLRPLGALAALAVPFAGLRDSNLFLLYFLVVCAVVGLALRCLRGPAPRPPRRAVWAGLGLIGLIVLACLVHSLDMKAVRRNWQSVGAVVSLRLCTVLLNNPAGGAIPEPNHENIQWLAERYGLPVEDALARVGKTVYQEPPLSPQYERWLKEQGPRAVLGYMVRHPGWVLTVFNYTTMFSLDHSETYMQGPEHWRTTHLRLPCIVQDVINLTLTRLMGIPWMHTLLVLAGAALGLGGLARAWRRGFDHRAAQLAALGWLLINSMMIQFIATFGDFFENWRHAITGLIALYAAVPLALALAVECFVDMRRGE